MGNFALGREALVQSHTRTGFLSRTHWGIAQLAELPAVTRKVAGSKPAAPAFVDSTARGDYYAEEVRVS